MPINKLWLAAAMPFAAAAFAEDTDLFYCEGKGPLFKSIEEAERCEGSAELFVPSPPNAHEPDSPGDQDDPQPPCQ